MLLPASPALVGLQKQERAWGVRGRKNLRGEQVILE
jgi:hypothetical protein